MYSGKSLACLCKRPHIYVPVITSLTSHVYIYHYHFPHVFVYTYCHCLTIQKASYHYHFSARAAVYPSSLVWLLWANVFVLMLHSLYLVNVQWHGFSMNIEFQDKVDTCTITIFEIGPQVWANPCPCPYPCPCPSPTFPWAQFMLSQGSVHAWNLQTLAINIRPSSASDFASNLSSMHVSGSTTQLLKTLEV